MLLLSGGYCLALDMTARDFQNEAKRGGLPWTMAKVFKLEKDLLSTFVYEVNFMYSIFQVDI